MVTENYGPSNVFKTKLFDNHLVNLPLLEKWVAGQWVMYLSKCGAVGSKKLKRSAGMQDTLQEFRRVLFWMHPRSSNR